MPPAVARGAWCPTGDSRAMNSERRTGSPWSIYLGTRAALYRGGRRMRIDHPRGGIVTRMPTTLRPSWFADPDAAWRRHLRRLRRPAWLAPFRTAPASAFWGLDRGTPVDRYYIERFVAAHRADIRGHVVEMHDSRYTDQFGTGVTRRDVLDIDGGNPNATIVADLTAAGAVADDTFDCFVLTQTLQFILDVPAALAQVHRILRPGGVALVPVPAVSRLAPG